MTTLPRDFFIRQSQIVGKELLGKYLVRKIDGKNLIGKIVETESYLPFIDPAAHSYAGMTPRNKVLFGEAGYSYIYSIHKYFCLNVVCDDLNVPGCVLIRAIEPLAGKNFMREYRQNDGLNIANGPGRLCQALKINRIQNALDLTAHTSELQIIKGISILESDIITTPRIGISKATTLPLRFYLRGNKFISRREKL